MSSEAVVFFRMKIIIFRQIIHVKVTVKLNASKVKRPAKTDGQRMGVFGKKTSVQELTEYKTHVVLFPNKNARISYR